MKVTKTLIASIAKNPKTGLKDLGEDEIAAIIQYANYQYYSTDKSVMTDDIYDIIKSHLEKMNPKHPILSHVGAYVDDDDNRKEKLPYWMGSMDKIKAETGSLDAFKRSHTGTYVLSDKLDGNSALFHLKKGEAKLFTRGDGEFGQNISHLMPFVQGFPNIEKLKGKVDELTIRGELIMTKEDFECVKEKGANARNMVAGLANAKMPDLEIAKRVRFIAYNVYHPQMTVEKQMQLATKLGFTTVYHNLIASKDLTFQYLSDFLVKRRKESDFEIDGIIVHHNEYHKIVPKKNPTCAFAFKTILTQETAEVVVTNVEWNVSKDGYLKPVVEFDGVKLSGVIIKRATGINGEFIYKNVIGPGSRIIITRSGDVIPKIIEILSKSSSGKPQMPEENFEWNDSRKEIKIVGNSDDYERMQLEHFFNKVDIKGISKGTVKKLYEFGFTTIPKVLKMNQKDLDQVDGLKNKATFIKNLKERMADLDCATLMEASNAFGRGFGEKKLKLIIEAIPECLDPKYKPTIKELIVVEGVSTKTAEKFIDGLPKYHQFIKLTKLDCNTEDYVEANADDDEEEDKPLDAYMGKKKQTAEKEKEKKGTVFANEQIVFTGFTNKEWEAFIEKNGGKVGSSVSGKTTLLVAKDITSESNKMTQAKERGIKIMSLAQFTKVMEEKQQ